MKKNDAKTKRLIKRVAQTMTDMSYYGPYWNPRLGHRTEVPLATLKKARILLGVAGVLPKVKIKADEHPLYYPA